MAKVVVFTPDLLFGSSLVGALVATGHSAAMCSGVEALEAEAPAAACVIVDLTDSVTERLAELAQVKESGVLDDIALLGYHSHVDPDSRDLGIQAGITKVVPRSRMHREPGALVDALLSSSPDN
ncbi:MAG: hypothetical protein NTY57_05840 [Solirubrobacterales bacterium]|nr:hypothetical protein [Solirubrobacterales bacterium]